MIMAAEGSCQDTWKKQLNVNIFFDIATAAGFRGSNSGCHRGFASTTFREPCGAACHQVIWEDEMGCFLCCLIQIFSFFDLNCVQELFFLERHAYCRVLSFGIPDCFLVEALFTYTNCKWIMSISWGLPKPGNYLDSHNLFTLMRGTRTWPSGDNPSHLPEGIRSAASLPSQIDDTLVGGISSWNSSKETQIKQFGVQTDFAPVDMEKIIVIVLFKDILSRPKRCQMLSDWIVMNRVLKLEVFLPKEFLQSFWRWMNHILGGGFKCFLFPSRPRGNDRIRRAYFSDGLVKNHRLVFFEKLWRLDES